MYTEESSQTTSFEYTYIIVYHRIFNIIIIKELTGSWKLISAEKVYFNINEFP